MPAIRIEIIGTLDLAESAGWSSQQGQAYPRPFAFPCSSWRA